MNLVEELKKIIGEDKVSNNETILFNHSQDESGYDGTSPDVVVFPESKEDVSAILIFANEHKIPVVGFGAGSGVEGQAIPIHKGITIDFERMNKIVDVRPEDLVVTVQPGVTHMQLNERLKQYGLFFPIDPGADATIGGMVSTNASGTLTVRYGNMLDQILNLEVVLADGTIIETGSLAKKSSSGYNLTSLFTGSEGTLGLFTEISLRLHGISEDIVSARSFFDSVEDAVNASVGVLTMGIPIARIELVDARSMAAVNKFSDTDYPEVPTLFLEFHGNKSGNKEDIELVQAIMKEFGSKQFLFETDSVKRAELWKARHELNYALRHGNPDLASISTDVCVPISSLPENISFADNQLDELGLKGGIVGHVGDGNFHVMILYDANSKEQTEKAEQLDRDIVEYALKSGGTCTGEHGVGIGKLQFQRQEHGAALDVMIALKKMFDPNNILNPGKIIPQEELEKEFV